MRLVASLCLALVPVTPLFPTCEGTPRAGGGVLTRTSVRAMNDTVSPRHPGVPTASPVHPDGVYLIHGVCSSAPQLTSLVSTFVSSLVKGG